MTGKTLPNTKYIRIIPVFGLLLFAALFLPFISLSEQGISATAIKILINAAGATGSTKGGAMLGVLVVLTGLSALLSLSASILTLLVRKMPSAVFSVFAFLFCALSAVFIIFTVTGAINASGLLQTKFLIKYLGIGYWSFLALSFAGLAVSMLAAKKSPGYIVLVTLSIIWLIPIAWVVMTSFRAEAGSYTSYFIPKQFTLSNYITLLTDNSQFHYIRWFGNTLLVSVCSCLLTTFITLSTAYTLSRLRFEGRKRFMDALLVLGMSPGFLSMIAVYYILKGLGLNQSLVALILVYSASASLGYYIAKGFFDTIPKAMDEAAYIDGATKWYVFTRITMPLSKPIIMYTLLSAFIAPWADYIFASIIMGDNYDNYTLAVGLYMMLSRENIATWYTRFAAGAVLVSIPIAILFVSCQKFYTQSLSGSVKG